jgi:ATP-dependent exoDNAse (exonuclease V) alpha subunit
VFIKEMTGSTKFNLSGYYYHLSNDHTYFMPNSHKEKKELVNLLTKQNDKYLNEIREHWIDLRAQYACTIDKSQGSTYDQVFIDLDDIAKCNVPSQVARMCYVAVSRAKHKVYLTGDLK